MIDANLLSNVKLFLYQNKMSPYKKWIFLGFLISSLLVSVLISGFYIEQHGIHLFFHNTNGLRMIRLCDNGACVDQPEFRRSQNHRIESIPVVFEQQSDQISLSIQGARVVLIKKISIFSQNKPIRFSALEFANTFHANIRVWWMIIKENALFLWCAGKNPHIYSQLNNTHKVYDTIEFDLLYPQWQFHAATLLRNVSWWLSLNLLFAGVLFGGKSMRNTKYILLEIMHCIGFYIVILITTTILLTSILFMFDVSISLFHFPASLAISSLCFFMASFQKRKKRLVIALVCSMLILSVCMMISSSIYDLSWDGNGYQKTAIGSLKNGWNPIYQSNRDFQRTRDALPDFLKDRYVLWVDHYPKAPWIFAATLYKITNNIETGKALNLLTGIAVFCLFLHYLHAKRFSLAQSAIISGMIVITPVTLTQMFSNYVDGILALSLYLLILACVMIVDTDACIDKKEKWSILFCSILFCSNIKFTGFVFAAVFCTAFFLFMSIKTTPFQIVFRSKPFSFFMIAFCCSIIIVGSSSYLKNIWEHGHIFYPLMGAEKIDNMTGMRPASFSKKTGVERLLFSIFSKVSLHSPEKPELKFPFTFDILELSNLISTDARTSGYGVWFSGILILSMLILVAGLSDLFIKNRRWFVIFAIIIGNSTLLLLLMEESWWARLAPTLYIFPLVAAILGFVNTKRTLITQCVTGLLLFAMLGNILCFALFNTVRIFIKNTMTTMELNDLQKNAQQKTAVLSFQRPGFGGALYNLDDLGIRYIVSQESLPTGKTIYMGITYIISQ